ncbi:hypothetical protein H0H92_001507 [Tricholoma furcatifolium]|nr:hypothetical protein H0H92_001507 [Tricholoma furcatifolium]
MAPLPSRKSLESMKRVDLQRLCKDYGVKANLKSEALIDLLIDTAKPVPANSSARRYVSTRTSNRAGPSRFGSIVIHDTNDEDDEQRPTKSHVNDGLASDIPSAYQPEPTPPVATRTRKGKDQTRLGVGRPVVAGGSGPRAVTKSVSLTKVKRGKGSKALKIEEMTRKEVEEGDHGTLRGLSPIYSKSYYVHASFKELHEDPSQKAEDSNLSKEHPLPGTSIDLLATIDQCVSDALRPLHEQIKSMKSELECMQALKTEVERLKKQVKEIASLKEAEESLSTDRNLAKANETTSQHFDFIQVEGMSTPPPSTPKRSSTERDSAITRHYPDSVTVASSTIPIRPSPGVSTMLGKRYRDSSPSDVEDDNLDVNTIVGQPVEEMKRSKKRVKISSSNQTLEGLGPPYISKQDLVDSIIAGESREPDKTGPGFKVFSGLDLSSLDLLDPPPPTETLPDFFPATTIASEVPIISRQTLPATSTASATENQQPFSFAFHQTLSSTPAHGIYMPSFPYPEPPQSPSPSGPNITGFLTQPGRSDIFQSFGFPTPGRSLRATGLRNTSGITGGFVDPAALMRQTHSDSSESTSRSAQASSSAHMEIGEPQQQFKRTMYGTELDGDTRFGDFGVEGVGNHKGGFWASGRF